ncbi:hypothetical protein MRB53_019526 [Persea americana]|uniref:Uncharacterized protein n=1 Tax=Persea americana TaxID=3435 RepID=A0ACC2KZJ5_PERAE|nr:hypothetical protein MRB53_019526 [Persea americana]
MSKTPSPSQFLDLSSPQSLSDWLAPRLPTDAFSSWGSKPGTKNVHNLWLELSQGETSLADSTPPIRTVHVATIRIRSSSRRILLESHQELSDGSVRTRLRPLSEKMKPGESVEAAVQRAVKEELGSALPAGGGVRIVPGSYERRVEERLSVSYPGLPACYVLHSVDAWVEGLPDCEFCTVEEDEYEGCREAARVAEKAVSEHKDGITCTCSGNCWKHVTDDLTGNLTPPSPILFLGFPTVTEDVLFKTFTEYTCGPFEFKTDPMVHFYSFIWPSERVQEPSFKIGEAEEQRGVVGTKEATPLYTATL